MTRCVENEPPTGLLHSEKDNCARVQRSKVPIWARVETPEWRQYGVCNASTPTITRAVIEAQEKKERERVAKYNLYCGVANKANCSEAEICFCDGEHDEKDSRVMQGGLPHGAVCLCQYPLGRANADGTGACVACKAGDDGKPAYVMVPGSNPPAVEGFKYGQFACALGANATGS